MDINNANRLGYLTPIDDEPRETYVERTVAQLRRALTEHPEDELYLLHRLMIWLSVSEDHEETMRIARRILEIDTKKEFDFDTLHIMARVFADLKDTGKAIEYYTETIRMNIEKLNKIQIIHEEPIIELAEIYEALKDWDNALKTYDLLANEKMLDCREEMYRRKGHLYMRINKPDLANDCFDKAIECCMQYEWLVRRIGNMIISKGFTTADTDLFKKDLEKEEGKADAYCRLGLIYQDNDDDLLAMHYYSEALKLKPCFPEAHNNMALLAFDQLGDLQKSATLLHLAKEEANKVIKDFEMQIESGEEKIISLQSEKDDSRDEEFIAAKAREIREIETKIHLDESNIEHYQWLLILFDLNLSRVYSKMTDFAKAAHYKSEFLGNVGFYYHDEDDDENDM